MLFERENLFQFGSTARSHNYYRAFTVKVLIFLFFISLLVLVITRQLIWLFSIILLPILIFIIVYFSKQKPLTVTNRINALRNSTLDMAGRAGAFVNPKYQQHIVAEKSIPTISNRARPYTNQIKGILGINP